MTILGLNIYHGDSSACILQDGKVLCAFEEERFTRKKHWAGFPIQSIQNCLNTCDLSLNEIDFITISRDPNHNKLKKILFALKNPLNIFNYYQRSKHIKIVSNVKKLLKENFDTKFFDLENKIKFIEHHNSHLASAFFASPFNQSAILTIDGFGDFTSTVLAYGEGNEIKKIKEVNFPHSVGQFYTAFTQYLGFHHYGDEYKVMGLSPYGTPRYLDKLEKILLIEDNGLFKLNLDFFDHHTKGVTTSMLENNDPTPSLFYSKVNMEKVFGKIRLKDEKITQHHIDIASSVQVHCENVIFHLLKKLYDETGSINLCLAGGVGQNSVANGKILSKTNFKNLYIPPAAHDAGTSIGSTLYHYYSNLTNDKWDVMTNPYLGSSSSNDEIEELLLSNEIEFKKYDETKLIEVVSDFLIEGNVVGWFHGRAEFGPRALGGRSILVDPRRKDAKQLLNEKIKKRESFRPFAPSILEENVKDYFDVIDKAPFMEKVLPIKRKMRSKIPAVTHVDGSGRLQTVNRKVSPRYHKLITAFYKKSGVPILLNTSFNENEPIVNKPLEALNCYLRTNMDVLVLENYVINRKKS